VLNGSESRIWTDDLRVYRHGSLKIPLIKIVSESLKKKGSMISMNWEAHVTEILTFYVAGEKRCSDIDLCCG
jgi:hypothetical protein